MSGDGYERLARLGRGGMGVVDLARTADGTEVALKRLTLHGSTEDIARARQRIEREAEVLRRLDHPNIVPLLDLLEDGDEITLVMPYLPGGTLADRVAADGPRPAEEVAALLDQLARALAEAHRAGVVHRDLKPANVLFGSVAGDRSGVPHLADFGVASSREDTAGLTVVGTVVGTPAYMAPEQARGEDTGPAADVFSLGATLLFALTGDGPYGKGAGDLLMVRAAQGKVVPVPRSVPRPLRDQLAAMLDPRPERRPSAAALVGGPEGTLVAGPPMARRRRWPRAVAIGTIAIAGVVAAVLVASRETESPAAAPTTTLPTTSGCTPLPYQPCGQPTPAPGTDGRACLAAYADYDGAAANGCEAKADALVDGQPFAEGAEPLRGTVVPRDDVDTFAMAIGDGSQLLCDGRFVLTLTAPSGMTLRLELLRGEAVEAETTSADGVPASITRRDPRCLLSDAGTYTARVSPIGSDRAAGEYVLERSGSF